MEKETLIYQEKATSIWWFPFKIVFFAYMLFRFLKSNFKESESNLLNDLVGRWIIGFSLLFYSIFLIFDIVKYIKNKKNGEGREVVIKIDKKGITDYTFLKDLGIIYWEDIEVVGVKNSLLNHQLIIKVKNPLEYINRANNNFKLKKLLRENNAKYQTPIVIITDNLEMSNNQLRDLIKLRLKSKTLK